MLPKTTSDLGLELVGRSSTGVFVKDMAPGSPAHQVGGLVAGDQIVEVNGVSTGEALCVWWWVSFGMTTCGGWM